MTNPWNTTPLDDYETHMSFPEVRQLAPLSDLFREALPIRSPQSLAILGVTGGNGLEHIDSGITKRIVSIDFNSLYLDAVRHRFPALPGLQCVCIDLAQERVALEPADLVHAALLFEHTGLGRCLENAVSLVAARGALSVVLQLPSEFAPEVSKSPVQSMQRLSSHFSLIDSAVLAEQLKSYQFRLEHETRRSLPAGKAFWMGIFVRY